jgi:hypothetical protein
MDALQSSAVDTGQSASVGVGSQRVGREAAVMEATNLDTGRKVRVTQVSREGEQRGRERARKQRGRGRGSKQGGRGRGSKQGGRGRERGRKQGGRVAVRVTHR